MSENNFLGITGQIFEQEPSEYPLRESEVFLSHNGEPERLNGIAPQMREREQIIISGNEGIDNFREAWMNYVRNTPIAFVDSNSPVNRYNDETALSMEGIERTPTYIAGIDPYNNEPNVQLVSQAQIGDVQNRVDDLFVSSSNQPKRTDVQGYVKTNNNKELERIKNG